MNIPMIGAPPAARFEPLVFVVFIFTHPEILGKFPVQLARYWFRVGTSPISHSLSPFLSKEGRRGESSSRKEGVLAHSISVLICIVTSDPRFGNYPVLLQPTLSQRRQIGAEVLLAAASGRGASFGIEEQRQERLGRVDCGES